MTSTPYRRSLQILCFATIILLGILLPGLSLLTQVLVTSSFVMFIWSFASAERLLGAAAAARFAGIAMAVGWFAEQMGSMYGWFFGSYDYTDVLGPRLGDVPIVIPMMWFALSYAGYTIANLIVWQVPADGVTGVGRTLALSFLAALVVTGYDLGVDPYMVYELKAWIMEIKDGWWFGETLQGFVGWMLTSFTIVFLFRLSLRKWAPRPERAPRTRDVLVPLAIYGGLMLFEATQGVPVETRTIAVFVMGIPLFCAGCGLQRWRAARAAQAAPAAVRAAAEAPAPGSKEAA